MTTMQDRINDLYYYMYDGWGGQDILHRLQTGRL